LEHDRSTRLEAAGGNFPPTVKLSLASRDRSYPELRARLEAAGKPVGANDMLIAAHAIALGYTLVTDNVREFSRIKSLKVENWLR